MPISRMFTSAEDAEAAVGELRHAGFRETALQMGAPDDAGQVVVTVDAPFGKGVRAMRILEIARPGDAAAPVLQQSDAADDEPMQVSPMPLSSSMGIPVLTRGATPFSTLLNMPLLAQGAEAKTASFGMPITSSDATPFSSKFGMKILASQATPFSSALGFKTIESKATPFSALLGWKLLVTDRSTRP